MIGKRDWEGVSRGARKNPAISGRLGLYKVVEIVVILYEEEMNWSDDILEKEIVRLALFL